MFTHHETIRSKPLEPPNHLLPQQGASLGPAGVNCRDIFLTALRERLNQCPFDRVSAYKVRECRDTLQDNLDTVISIKEYQCARPSERHSWLLTGCTSEDRAIRLKRVPAIIAQEMGFNLIPAIAALHLEGVEPTRIAEFLQSAKPQFDRLLVVCEGARQATCRSIKPEYGAMKAGTSSLEHISILALGLAQQAVEFCERHSAL